MRKWRVGTISMGILLVVTGVLLLVSELQGLSGAMLIMRWWPAILIVLGLEILAYIFLSKEDQPKIKFDGLSIFLTVFIILISTGVYATHSFLKSDLANRFFEEVGFYKYESVFDKSYEVDAINVKRLEIDNSHGNITVRKYEGDQIKIEAVITIKSNDALDMEAIAERVVSVSEAQTTVIRTQQEGIMPPNRRQQLSVNYHISVPKELTHQITNKYGNTSLENLSGNIVVESSFGKTEVRDIQGDVRIESSFGEVRVRDISGRLEIENEHGNILYRTNKTAAQDIHLKSKMGSITTELAKDQQGSFKAATQFGKIHLEGFNNNNPEQEINKQNWNDTIGATTPVINLEAEHGNIVLTRK